MVVVTSLGPPEEGIRHVEAATTTYINEKPIGKGILYISEARVSWYGPFVALCFCWSSTCDFLCI